jgi:antitoxin ParD1/3/4
LAKNAKTDKIVPVGTKNISLPPELEAYVDAKVKSGEYAHASEVVRDGLRLLMREEAEKLEWLRDAIAEGIRSLHEGPTIPGEEIVETVKREGRARLKREREKRRD